MRTSTPGNGYRSRTHAYTLISVLLALILPLALTSCALLYRDLKPPTVELVSVQPGSLEGNLSLALTVRLRVSNPNSVKLPVRGGRFEIGLNGNSVADSALNEDFDIPASGSTDVDFKVNVNILQGIAIGLNMLNNDQPQVDWQLKGYIDVGMDYLGRVFINESGSVDLGTRQLSTASE